MNGHARLDDPIGPLERAFDVAVLELARPHRVRPELLEQHRRVRSQCVVDRRHRVQGLVVGLHQAESVLRRPQVDGCHGADGLAGVARLAARHGVLGDVDADAGGVSAGAERIGAAHYVVGGHDALHAWQRGRFGSVRPDEPCVGVGAPANRRVQHPRQAEVVDILAHAAHEARRLLAGRPRPDEAELLWPFGAVVRCGAHGERPSGGLGMSEAAARSFPAALSTACTICT